ncbi:hypothetical protein DXG01_015716 [Tephrocybe rancida]|nr:hypothetical protein DXG01_015716 [Tephrocybe rancida]
MSLARDSTRQQQNQAWSLSCTTSALSPAMSTTTITTSTPHSHRHRRHSSHPGFSHLLTSVLGSPFLTTSDLPELVDGAPLAVPRADTITRPSSPTPTVDSSTFSFVQYDPGAYTPYRTPLKGILPRIWDVFSPPRLPYNSYIYSYGSQRARGRYFDDSIDYSELDPLDGEEGELIAIDDEACFFVDSSYGSRAVTGIDIIALLPPELALHIFTHLSSSLPAVLNCGLVSHTWRGLATDNTVWRALFLARWKVDLARQGSRCPTIRWNRNSPVDSALWQPLDPPLPPPLNQAVSEPKKKRRAKRFFTSDGPFSTPSSSSTPPSRPSPHRFLALPPSGSLSRSPTPLQRTPPTLPRRLDLTPPAPARPKHLKDAPLQLDWHALYRTRLELDRRWDGTALMPKLKPKPKKPATPPGSTEQSSRAVPRPRPHPYFELCQAPKMVPYAPQIMSISGHKDSVYCLEFDSKRIITGSRDRTIKVWSVKDGRILGSFNTPLDLTDGEVRGHTGSVLCLKFSADWDSGENNGGDGRKRTPKQGFMVSGSSDCTICVWNLRTGARVGRGDREVKGELRTVLRGHAGGVLDLRIDDNWIVSCSKDSVVRVWDRKTLKMSRMLRGHDGPVNSIGLQSGRVVSASGEGKMIMWDIASGERIRTFEVQERGLACIEFKGDYIVSGTECKIKIWSALTGECLRAFVGHDGLVRALAFDPTSGRLVSTSYDKTVKLWDFDSGNLIREFKNTHTSHIFDVKFDASRIVSTSHDHKIVVIDFSKGLDTSLFV